MTHIKQTAEDISIPFLSERRKILIFYVLFFILAALTLLSPLKIAILSLMVCVLHLSLIYSYRALVENDPDCYIYNHTTFLIRTFWRCNLYMIYSGFLGLLYILVITDYSGFKPCTDYFERNIASAIMHWNVNQYLDLFSQCSSPFMKMNTTKIVIGIFIMVFPILIYLLNRLILGWSHAIRGINVTDTKL